MNNLTTVRLSAPTAKDCGKCHSAIYEEWLGSSHARAWTSPEFMRQTADHRIGDCLSCHAPETVFVGANRVQKRNYLTEEGVTCLTCHLHEGALHGPFAGGKYPPHAISGPDPLYRDSKLCGICHRGTFDAWQRFQQKAPEVATCQECHMARVKRKMTSAASIWGKPFVAMEKEHAMRSHSFGGEPTTVTAQPVLFETRMTSQGLVLLLVNNLPHPIPTGEFGFRRTHLRMELIGPNGRQMAIRSFDFYRDLGTALPSSEPLFFPLSPADLSIRLVRVSLSRMDQEDRIVHVIAEQTLSLDASKGE